MKKILITAVLALSTLAFTANAYMVGGQHMQRVSCTWGKYGNQNGNIGTYRAHDGSLYSFFFGTRYCPV